MSRFQKRLPSRGAGSADAKNADFLISFAQLEQLRLQSYGTLASLAGWEIKVSFKMDTGQSTLSVFNGKGEPVSLNEIKDVLRAERDIRQLVRRGQRNADDTLVDETINLVAKHAKHAVDPAAVYRDAKIQLAKANTSRELVTKALSLKTEPESTDVGFSAFLVEQQHLAEACILEYIKALGNSERPDLKKIFESKFVTGWFQRNFLGDNPISLDGKTRLLEVFYLKEIFNLLPKEIEQYKKLFAPERIIWLGMSVEFAIDDAERHQLGEKFSDANIRVMNQQIPVYLVDAARVGSLTTNVSRIARLTAVSSKLPEPLGARLRAYYTYLLSLLFTGRTTAFSAEHGKFAQAVSKELPEVDARLVPSFPVYLAQDTKAVLDYILLQPWEDGGRERYDQLFRRAFGSSDPATLDERNERAAESFIELTKDYVRTAQFAGAKPTAILMENRLKASKAPKEEDAKIRELISKQTKATRSNMNYLTKDAAKILKDGNASSDVRRIIASVTNEELQRKLAQRSLFMSAHEGSPDGAGQDEAEESASDDGL